VGVEEAAGIGSAEVYATAPPAQGLVGAGSRCYGAVIVAPIRAWMAESFLDETSPRYERMQRFVMFCIFLSVASMVAETVPGVAARHQRWLDLIEVVVVAVFTAEYAVNVWVAPDRRRYVLGVWGIIDLLAVLPSLIVMLNIGSAEFLGVMRVMRVLRILRVLKLAKVAAHKFHDRQKRGAALMDLQIFLLALFSALTIWSTLAYHAERSQPDTKFLSIPHAMWWGISTLTGTTYGDIYPTTLWGRIVAAGTALTGLALFGLLMNVIGEALQATLFGRKGSRTDGERPA
jgi:voltage-gated potassium channel